MFPGAGTTWGSQGRWGWDQVVCPDVFTCCGTEGLCIPKLCVVRCRAVGDDKRGSCGFGIGGVGETCRCWKKGKWELWC